MAGLSTIASTRQEKGFNAVLRAAGFASILLSMFVACGVAAAANAQIEALLQGDEAPHGIVFEIVEPALLRLHETFLTWTNKSLEALAS